MSLQNIIDSAQQIEFDRRRIVAQTLSRSQRIKTAERNSAQPWRFIVTPAGSLKFSDNRDVIEDIMEADRVDEAQIQFNNAAYLTAYQGQLNQTQLNTLNISATTTASVTINSLPTIGDTINTTNVTLTARSFSTTTSVTYNRALSTSRNDFLITNDQFQSNYSNFGVGSVLSTSTYITGSQTISSVTWNYITLNGIGYTRIVMSANANANSAAATVDGDSNINVNAARTTTISSSTVIFQKGDIIQPNNSRYPYSVTGQVIRGSGSSVTVNLNRALITSEGVTLTGQGIKVGNSCSWRVVVSGLPTYQVVPYDRLQFTGNFELVEKII